MNVIRLALVALLLSTGCIYSSVRMPLDTDLDQTNLGSKIGESQATSILWLFAWGDAGTQAAARDGGITTLRHADRHALLVFFGVYAQQKTIVYGD